MIPTPQDDPEFYESVPTKRLFAWLIDTIITAIIALIIIPFTGFLGLLVWPIFWAIISLIYRTWTISNNSATWGMRLMSIELRCQDNGDKLDGSQAFWHSFGFLVSSAIFIVQLVSIFLMLTQRQGQSIVDLLLGTVMLNTEQS